MAFRKALHPRSPLFKFLVKSGIKIVKELLDKVNYYANIEKELRVTNHKRKIT